MATLLVDPSWTPLLEAEFEQPYMRELREYLAARKQRRVRIYPHSANWFRAFALTALPDVRVVILGQDPYHGPGQAHGLSFSVPPGVQPPPSLKNVYREIDDDLGEGLPRLAAQSNGCLLSWSRQGVFLLNSVLTVEEGRAASHQGRGWEHFTDAVVAHLDTAAQPLVFMLWGSYAQKKGQIIDTQRHCVLKCPHPSPLSAHRGFLGCRHFSAANRWLVQQGRQPVDWFSVVDDPGN